MPEDLSTTLALSCAVTALQGLVILLVWRRRRWADWLVWRAAIFVLGGCFLFLFLLDDRSMRQISVGLGTPAFIAATFAVWSSARVFAGKRPMWAALISAIGVWAGIAALTDTLDSLLPAALVHSAVGIGWIGGGAWEHWNARRTGRTAGEWGVIALYAVVALFFAIRLPFLTLLPFPLGARETDPMSVAVLVLGLDMAAILLTLFTLTGLRRPSVAPTPAPKARRDESALRA